MRGTIIVTVRNGSTTFWAAVVARALLLQVTEGESKKGLTGQPIQMLKRTNVQ